MPMTPSSDTTATTKEEPTLGIALGGGAIRGFAHLGVLAALHEQDDPRFRPKVVVGTSTGSIVAALYAAGLSMEEILAEARRFGWLSHVVGFRETVAGTLRDVRNCLFARTRSGQRTPRAGVLNSAPLGRWLDEIVARRLGDCTFDAFKHVRLAVVAADIESRQRVVLTSADLARNVRRALTASARTVRSTVREDCPTVGTGVRASTAVPGLFEVVHVGGMRLADGGMIDQVPVEVALAMGADVVVGVSLGMVQFFHPANTPLKAFVNFIDIMSREQIMDSLRFADTRGVGFEVPGIEETSLVNTRQFDRLISMGRRAMLAHMDRLAGAMESGA